MFALLSEWSSSSSSEGSHKFYNAYSKETDYGTCCFMIPHLDFVNPETKDLDPGLYDPSKSALEKLVAMV